MGLNFPKIISKIILSSFSKSAITALLAAFISGMIGGRPKLMTVIVGLELINFSNSDFSSSGKSSLP